MIPYHRLWFSAEQERWRGLLELANLSEYVRDKMRADVDRGVSLKALRMRLEEVDQEKARLEAAFRAKAVQVEDALAAFARAAALVRKNVAAVGPRASVQTTIAVWVRNNPNGRDLRRFLPPQLADDQSIAEILLRWPDSQPDLVRLLEKEREPPVVGANADEPRASTTARGEAPR